MCLRLHELENTRLKMSHKILAEGRLKENIALISDPRRRTNFLEKHLMMLFLNVDKIFSYQKDVKKYMIR